MSKESSLTSVVSIPEDVEKLDRLENHRPLTQLHSRFSGRGMQEEKEAWRAKERLILSMISDGRLRGPRDTLILCLSSNLIKSAAASAPRLRLLPRLALILSHPGYTSIHPFNNSSCF